MLRQIVDICYYFNIVFDRKRISSINSMPLVSNSPCGNKLYTWQRIGDSIIKWSACRLCCSQFHLFKLNGPIEKIHSRLILKGVGIGIIPFLKIPEYSLDPST